MMVALSGFSIVLLGAEVQLSDFRATLSITWLLKWRNAAEFTPFKRMERGWAISSE